MKILALIDNKITTYVDNIKNLSDTPSDDGLTAQELKGYFDGRTDKEVKEKLNSLIDALIAYGVEKLVASIDIQKLNIFAWEMTTYWKYLLTVWHGWRQDHQAMLFMIKMEMQLRSAAA